MADEIILLPCEITKNKKKYKIPYGFNNNMVILFSSVNEVKQIIQDFCYYKHYIVSRILNLRRDTLLFDKAFIRNHNIVEFDIACVKLYKSPLFKCNPSLNLTSFSISGNPNLISSNGITKLIYTPIALVKRNLLFFCFPVKVLSCKVYNEKNNLVWFQFFPIDEYPDLHVYCISFLRMIQCAQDVKQHVLMSSIIFSDYRYKQIIEKIEILVSTLPILLNCVEIYEINVNSEI